MNIIRHTYTIQLTDDEISTLENALHRTYMDLRCSTKQGDDTRADAAHELRNAFAALLNIRYMGEEA